MFIYYNDIKAKVEIVTARRKELVAVKFREVSEYKIVNSHKYVYI